MADRGRWTPNTDNKAVVIANSNQHRVPDRYGTDDQKKFGDAHPSLIHDPYDKYGPDSECDEPC